MFWGITLETTKRYSQVVDDDFHVSMAALEPRGPSSKGPNSQAYISVMLEREKSEFLLCNLHPDKLIQQNLDLHFLRGEEITFFLNGEGVVHLSGYITTSDDPGDYEEGSSESETEDVPNLAGKRKAIELLDKMQTKKTKMDVESDDSEEEDDDEDDEESDDEGSDSSEVEEIPSPKKFALTPKGQNAKGAQLSLQQTNQKSGQKGQFAKSPKQEGGKKQQQTPGGKQQQQQSPGGKQKQQQQSPGGKQKQQQTPGGKQQQANNKQTPKPGAQQTPKKEVNGKDVLDVSDSQKKKRKRNKKGKGNSTLNETSSPTATPAKTPATPAKTPAMQTPKPKPQKLQGGVVVEDLNLGEGKEAKPGSVVSLFYVGRFQKNNKVFDSAKKGESAFKFRLGRGEVIKGWDVGVQGMKIGGKRRITIPADQAYGSKGNEAIPPNSDLVFDVELQKIN